MRCGSDGAMRRRKRAVFQIFCENIAPSICIFWARARCFAVVESQCGASPGVATPGLKAENAQPPSTKEAVEQRREK
jgi:hypothetical protein